MFNLVITYITLLVVAGGLVAGTWIVAFRQGEAVGMKKSQKVSGSSRQQDIPQSRAA